MTAAPAALDAQGRDGAATRSVPQLLVERARATPNGVALRCKTFGRWAPTTWNEYADRVARVAEGLRNLGVADGDRVAIVSDNTPEWLITDVAVQALGAVSVGVDPAIEATEVQAILEHAGAAVVIAADEEQYDKVAEVRSALGALRSVIVVDPRGIALDAAGPSVRTLAQVEESGASGTIESLAAAAAAVAPTHVATLIYGRDGAGAPEGTSLTHANLLAAADRLTGAVGVDASTEVLSYLPLALVAERVTSLVGALSVGFTVSFGDGGDSFLTDMQQVQPTFVLGVPFVFETIHATVERRMQDASFLKRKTWSFWMARGRRIGAARKAGRAGIGGRLLHGIGWVALYRPLRIKLGLLRARDALCIATPAPETGRPVMSDPADLDFFWALGVPVRAGTLDQEGFLHLDTAEAGA